MESIYTSSDRSPEKYLTLALGAKNNGMNELAERLRGYATHLAEGRTADDDVIYAQTALQELLLANEKGEGFGHTILFIGVYGARDSEESIANVQRSLELPDLRSLPLKEMDGSWVHSYDSGRGVRFELRYRALESGQERFMELSGHIAKSK